MNQQRQGGSAIEFIILGIVVVAVVVLVLWRYVAVTNDQNSAELAQQTSNNQNSQPVKPVDLIDWGVQLQSYGTSYGTLKAEKLADSYKITSSILEKADYTCSDATEKNSLGTISRHQMAMDDMEMLKLGDYYYMFTAAHQSDCYKDKSHNELQKTFSNNLARYLKLTD